jgi:hypothetical protein
MIKRLKTFAQLEKEGKISSCRTDIYIDGIYFNELMLSILGEIVIVKREQREYFSVIDRLHGKHGFIYPISAFSDDLNL